MTKNEFWQRVFIVSFTKESFIALAARNADMALATYSDRFDKDGNLITDLILDDED